MKMFVKFCLILSGVLVLLGIAGIGASFAMGLKPAELLDLAHYPGQGRHRLKVADDIQAKIDGLTDNVWNGLDDLEEDLDDLSDDLDEIEWPVGRNSSGAEVYYEYPDTDIRCIDLALSYGHLEIYSHDKDFVILEADNAGNTFRCNLDGSRLALTDNRKLRDYDDKHLLSVYLYLPAQTFEAITASIGSGNVALMGQLNADTLDFSCGAGDFRAESLTCHDLEVSSGVGNVDIDLLDISGEAEINMGAGNAAVTARGPETDYNYELNCTVGQLCVNGRHHDEDEHHTHREGFGNYLDIDHDADKDICINLGGAGNLELNFTDTFD